MRGRGEPTARSARYEPASGLVIVELTNGAVFGFPAKLGPGLERATDEQMARVAVSPRGAGLRWDELDAEDVAGMLERMFGVRTAMSALGSRGGRSTSEAKAAAARR